MAYDEQLTQNLREAIGKMVGGDTSGISEKRMMGGVCFMLNGNMVCGADRSKDGQRRYMFRTGKGNPAADALPGGEPMVQGGRVMSGLYFVDAALSSDGLMQRWLAVALDHVRGLPAK